ncbi:MAG TPA: YHS domain-containing protein, partial [Hyphomicrobiales bacterium]|nr:YHS domain-containing protein [Hyphomicrobiales bacterium]
MNHQHAHGGHGNHAASAAPEEFTDPVCGMRVAEDTPLRTEYAGETYRFCGKSCLTKFQADPQRYLSPAPAGIEPAPPGTRYTCPMHPEIEQDHMGACPKCGMALEPLMPSLEEAENPELTDFRRRFWFTLPLTLVVFVLAMFGHQLQWLDMRTQTWVELVLATPVVLWAGLPFFERCIQSLRRRSPNMWTLIGLGTGAAYGYSLAATLFP